jgi:pimeloyl-ACP methyl ester carboxylesterase
MEVLATGPAGAGAIPDGVVRLSYRSTADGPEDWALLWPPERGRTWVVCLHGHGSHGDQLYVRADIRGSWLPEFRRRGLGILTPNLRDNAWMSPAAAADLHSLLQHLRDVQDAEQLVILSGSMGGTGALIYAVLHPEDLAGVAALCPATDVGAYQEWCSRQTCPPVLSEIADAINAAYGGAPQERRQAFARHSCIRRAGRLSMPVFLAHGEADALIPVANSRALSAALRNGNLRYVEMPGGDHDAPLALPIIREALDWILPGWAAP